MSTPRKGKERRDPIAQSGDVHAEVIKRSVRDGLAVIAALDPESPLESLDDRIRETIRSMSALMDGLDPLEIIEQSRLRALPWHAGQPTYQAGAESGFSIVEVISIFALTGATTETATGTRPAEIIEGCVALADQLLDLGGLRAVVGADPDDPLSEISGMLQTSELRMRSSSYPEALNETLHELFEEPSTDATLRDALGFGLMEATSVLDALHELQVVNMNRRQEGAARAMHATHWDDTEATTRDERARAARTIEHAFNPNAVAATVSIADLDRSTGLGVAVIGAVLDAFTWAPDADRSTADEILGFLSGDNPLRMSPVVRTKSSRAMLVHPASTQSAIRERLELALRRSSGWENYQAHRGTVLEARTQAAFDRLLGPTRAWHGLHYYLPAADREESLSPDKYTKRVEGDHLYVFDDVAIVVEDKAVSLSSRSRAGDGFRIQKDLTGIITNAANQADRLIHRIRTDRGIRVHGEGWIDLSGVREFHAVAVSLDDLTSTSTATADLVTAGLIKTSSVPWTVSIHDLDLIAELSSGPEEFLLYLRRRRHPLATALYTAPDELDLYLYFLEAGLYVEDDPDAVRARFSFVPEPTTASRNRWSSQVPGIVTSRTDPLDAWYFEDFLRVRSGRSRLPNAPAKPTRAASPLDPMIRKLRELEGYAATSIAATLLAGDARTQRRMAQYGSDVVRASDRGRIERSVSIPVPSLSDDGWLLVWASCPSTEDREAWEKRMRLYLRLKGNQCDLSRAALFAYDGATGALLFTAFELVPEILDASEEESAKSLRPPSEFRPVEQVRKALGGQRPQPRRKGRRR